LDPTSISTALLLLFTQVVPNIDEGFVKTNKNQVSGLEIEVSRISKCIFLRTGSGESWKIRILSQMRIFPHEE
jgi:hypothetical protein